MEQNRWAIGVDLGGTKVEVAAVDATGKIGQHLRQPTDVKGGPQSVIEEIAAMVRQVREKTIGGKPAGVGVGVAGQVASGEGVVRFAPNLRWHDVPLQDLLHRLLDLPVLVTNDVRLATWGEWQHGAGQGCDDLVCVFVGTGVGGGVVSSGTMLHGASNTAGEIGHMIIDLHGPICTCGNRGCLEALAGGWAIARQALKAINDDPQAGAAMLAAAGLPKPVRPEDVTAAMVGKAATAGDPLARLLLAEVGRALAAGAVSLVHAFNPTRLILGGGVISGMISLVDHIDQEVHRLALSAARERLAVIPAKLGGDAGVIGGAALALRSGA